MEMFPQDAAAGILSGDGLLMLADALQPSHGNPADEEASAGSAGQDPGEAAAGEEVADADCARQQQLLTCLAAACQFQPPVNIMAGMRAMTCVFNVSTPVWVMTMACVFHVMIRRIRVSFVPLPGCTGLPNLSCAMSWPLHVAGTAYYDSDRTL